MKKYIYILLLIAACNPVTNQYINEVTDTVYIKTDSVNWIDSIIITEQAQTIYDTIQYYDRTEWDDQISAQIEAISGFYKDKYKAKEDSLIYFLLIKQDHINRQGDSIENYLIEKYNELKQYESELKIKTENFNKNIKNAQYLDSMFQYRIELLDNMLKDK
ncbi:MAG: hypothetical protein OEL54_06390 [Flavobacteriaceae bacterium]|nr:hypothetical protein [Flavobacteriaceae bacterium]